MWQVQVRKCSDGKWATWVPYRDCETVDAAMAWIDWLMDEQITNSNFKAQYRIARKDSI